MGKGLKKKGWLKIPGSPSINKRNQKKKEKIGQPFDFEHVSSGLPGAKRNPLLELQGLPSGARESNTESAGLAMKNGIDLIELPLPGQSVIDEVPPVTILGESEIGFGRDSLDEAYDSDPYSPEKGPQSFFPKEASGEIKGFVWEPAEKKSLKLCHPESSADTCLDLDSDSDEEDAVFVSDPDDLNSYGEGSLSRLYANGSATTRQQPQIEVAADCTMAKNSEAGGLRGFVWEPSNKKTPSRIKAEATPASMKRSKVLESGPQNPLFFPDGRPRSHEDAPMTDEQRGVVMSTRRRQRTQRVRFAEDTEFQPSRQRNEVVTSWRS